MSQPSTLPARLSDLVTTALQSLDAELPEGFDPKIEPTADLKFGHYQCNAAMVLAKALKDNPRNIATQLTEAIDADGICTKLEVAGPGFLNFYLTPEILAETVAALLSDDRLGVPEVAEPERIVIDYSSPNVAKPMHVGHIRSTIIGDSLARIARFIGHEVIADNHIGDWGTQFGMILYGWKNLLNKDALEADPIRELVRCYREVTAMGKADQAVADAAREELVKLQAGDPENTEIWKRCIELSKQGLDKIYQRLDVHFDTWYGESYYNDMLAPLVEDMIDKGIATENDGAICVFFDGVAKLENKPSIIRKSDGGFNYATTDLATIDHRVGEQGATKIWYVVGIPQELHFREIFETVKRRGTEADLTHVAFGSIMQTDPENPGAPPQLMRTRTGENVGLVEVLEGAIERARATVEEKNPELPEDEKTAIAEAIGIGGVKYFELSHDRVTDYVFDWDRMLSQQGNTAPYLMFAYVRTRAIFRKLDGQEQPDPTNVVLTEPAELALAFKLSRFADAVPSVLTDHRPHLLSNYLYDLAKTYHSFIEACHVLKSEGTTRNSRLVLCEATAQVLAKGLDLLGIKVVERM